MYKIVQQIREHNLRIKGSDPSCALAPPLSTDKIKRPDNFIFLYYFSLFATLKVLNKN